MVSSKSIPKTPLELWKGRKPNFNYIRIWCCPAHMLKGKMDKMELRLNVCLFVGYPKGTKGYYFYNSQDKKIFVSTNAIFLEDKYIEERGSKSRVILEETNGENPKQMVAKTHTQNFHGGFVSLPHNISDSNRREIDATHWLFCTYSERISTTNSKYCC
jgi:hypothetical protein